MKRPGGQKDAASATLEAAPLKHPRQWLGARWPDHSLIEIAAPLRAAGRALRRRSRRQAPGSGGAKGDVWPRCSAAEVGTDHI